ncbi:TPA: toprim domain-containing protein [Streptococcus pneumoniae]|uniref:PBECR4 domain-containing protein n=1 Tax=Streptococcus oralis TaxID=1303 RepID=UPI001EB238E7|nr:toprim domain-containing protein [Streptococcus oralis]HEW2151744.1 toprim domain-containing protein [Streptococcus pneumoniae]
MPLTKAQAKSLDILEVARSLGMEMKRKSHREYYWAEHDSFKIDAVKNTWHWYSQADKYGDTINLVQEMRNVSYKEAMVFLETGSFPEAKPVEEERKPFNYTLAPYEQPFVEARSYLKEIRGLSDDTIDFFLEKGVLAQAKRKDKDGVIEDVLVFKYLDRNQQLVGASLQGLVPDQERHPGKGYLKQIMYQSESISGLNVSIGSPKRLIVTEAPIDLMSYYELHKGELNDVRLVAMEGLKEGVLSHYVLEILQERGELTMDERDYTKSSELTRTSKFLSVAAETSTLFQDHKYDDLITLAVDHDKAGTDFITKLREKKIPVIDARPPKREGQEKTDWNEILKQTKKPEKAEEIQSSSHFPDTSHLSPEDATWLKENWNNIGFSVEPKKQMVIDSDKTVTYEKPSNLLGDGREPKKQIQSTEKAPENSQEQMNDRTSGGTGSLQPKAEGSTSPVLETSTFEQTVTSHPTSSYPYLQFSTNYDKVQRRTANYHPITPADLRRLNQYAPSIQSTASWYLNELADSKISFVYADHGEKNVLQVTFQKDNFIHLSGIRPFEEGKGAANFLDDIANGQGHYDGMLISNAIKDKLQVLPMLRDILDPHSFVLDDLSSVEKLHNLNMSEAIKAKDEDFLLLFKDIGDEKIPASLMKLKGELATNVKSLDEKIILGVYRDRDGHIEQLSINEEYVKDNGAEMLSVLKNKQFEEVSKEIEQTTLENTLNSPLLDSATFTQVLDTVYNLGVPGDISKTPKEFHQAWNQYLDYAKQHNDKFDQIVAAAEEDHLLDTNSDFYKEWKQDHIYKENYHVRLQWSEERPEGPILPFKETELISYQDFARELYKANQSFYQLYQEGLKQVTGGHPEAYISPTKIQFSIYAPDGELIQDSIRYNIGEEINPIAHKERLGTREMREYPELMKIDGAIFTPYHLERLASELDISQFSYALEDTLYADQLLSQLPFGDLENSPIGFTDSSHDARLGFISFDGMDSVEVENLSAWFDKLGVKDSPMDQVALVEKWQKEIKSLSEKVEQTIAIVREEFEKSQEEEIKLEEQGYNKQELERDADADGVSDEEELLQGTNPYDFRSKPGSKPEGEDSLQADEVVLAAGSLAVADFIQNKDMAGLSRHLKEGIKEFLDSDKYKDYLTKMSQLNNYSNRNLRLILAQNPEARQVTSFKQWKENFGRYVKKGEKALRIFKPMTKIKKDENNQPILDKNGKPETVTFFGLVPVFDVSQTEGKEMPKAAEVKEQLTDLDYANLYRALMAIAKENDVSVRFEEMENNKHGYYSVPENQIVLRSNEMNKAQIIKTFLHEMAHAELHHADNPQKENLTRSTAELQAESVAYVVSSYYGIDTSEYSFNYLSGWSADKETLADLEAQLDIVQQEAKSLMVRMDQALEQLRLSQEKQTKRSFEQKLEKFKEQGKQAVEEHKQELKADAQSKKEKGFSK